MKKYLLAIIYLFLLSPFLFSQQYHTPGEIFKILNDSKMMYEIGMLDRFHKDDTIPPPLLDHGLFISKSDDGGSKLAYFERVFPGDTEYIKKYKAAESIFAERKYSEARDLYLQALVIVPSNFQIMTYIGQTYDEENNLQEAINWYKKAIAVNYYDYMAHWFLADVFSKAGKKDSAVQEIILAKILNRNHIRIGNSLDIIFKESNLVYHDWEFKPIYEIEPIDTHRISIKYSEYHSEWMPYSLCKAIWHYEPGYRETMLKNIKQLSKIVEETECVVNVIVGIENSKEETKDKSLIIAEQALDNKMFNSFIIYEVILPKDPFFVFNLSPKDCESVAEYVRMFRTKE